MSCRDRRERRRHYERVRKQISSLEKLLLVMYESVDDNPVPQELGALASRNLDDG